MAPHETRTAKIKIPIETARTLILSSGINRFKQFMAMPRQASRNPKNTPKKAVTTAKIFKIRLMILIELPGIPWAAKAKAEILLA